MSETLTINAAAAALGISRSSVYNWIRNDHLTVERVPRGSHQAMRIRRDSPAFGWTPDQRRQMDPRTAWRLAAKARSAA